MKNDEIQRTFEEHAGGLYRRFLTVLSRGYPNPWIDKMWDEFVVEMPAIPKLTQTELRRLFAICPVHNEPLVDGEAKAVYGRPAADDELLKAEKSDFPLAECSAFGGCTVGKSKKRPVRYCPKCRSARQQFIRARKTRIEC